MAQMTHLVSVHVVAVSVCQNFGHGEGDGEGSDGDGKRLADHFWKELQKPQISQGKPKKRFLIEAHMLI